MRLTVDDVMAMRPCEDWPRERVEELFGGAESLYPSEIVLRLHEGYPLCSFEEPRQQWRFTACVMQCAASASWLVYAVQRHYSIEMDGIDPFEPIEPIEAAMSAALWLDDQEGPRG